MKMKRKALVLMLAAVILAALPVLAATLFSDDFNRADADLLGGNWVERGDGSFDVDIVTNRAELISAASNEGFVYNTTALGTADYTVQSVVNFPAGAGHRGVAGRRVNSSANDSDGYAAFIVEADDTIYLYKRVSGTWTQLGSFAVTILAATDYTVKLSMQGTTIKQFLNGVERISVTDSALSAAGDAALVTGGAGVLGARWDDFLVEDFGTAGRNRVIVSDARSVPRTMSKEGRK